MGLQKLTCVRTLRTLQQTMLVNERSALQTLADLNILVLCDHHYLISSVFPFFPCEVIKNADYTTTRIKFPFT